MRVITVLSRRGIYAVCVGAGLLPKAGALIRKFCGALPKAAGKILIVTQKKIPAQYRTALHRSLRAAGFQCFFHFVPDGEPAKSQKELFRLYQALLKYDFERRDTIAALGGGVVGDLAAFGASTYMRGLRFINVGTTLLAQVDSAIGGKTGINLPEGKNLVGTFYPPALVIADIDTLRTLPEREYRASMAEVVKYGMIRDAALFRLLEKNAAKILKRDRRLLTEIVFRCARIKGLVVSRDEQETRGERMILNYGHTFGHALEQVTRYRRWLHGEAVALGMVAAARLAFHLGYCRADDAKRQGVLLKQLHLPVSAARERLSMQAVLKAMSRDKKKSAGTLRFVLPVRIGKVRIVKGLNAAAVRKTLKEIGVQP